MDVEYGDAVYASSDATNCMLQITPHPRINVPLLSRCASEGNGSVQVPVPGNRAYGEGGRGSGSNVLAVEDSFTGVGAGGCRTLANSQHTSIDSEKALTVTRALWNRCLSMASCRRSGGGARA
jgi:hypothetical protein